VITPLQLGLLLLGLALLLGVLAYNRWSTRRQRPRLADPGTPQAGQAGGLATEARVDPVLQAPASAAAHAAAGDANLPSAPAVQPVLDVELDAIVLLAAEQPLSGDAILASLPGSRRVGSKPFFVEGQLLDAPQWEPPQPGQRYRAVRAGIQLANRAGPLNEIEFSEFVQCINGLAEALHLQPEYPDMAHEVRRARELDQFALNHDAQLSFTVRATRAAWSPGYLVQHALRAGFVAGALPGRMALPASASGAAPVLLLQYPAEAALAEEPEQAVLQQFALTLDVPLVARTERPYVRLRQLAQQLAHDMEGVLTDDAGAPLQAEVLDQIGADLEALYEALQERGLPAGAALTRRLFA